VFARLPPGTQYVLSSGKRALTPANTAANGSARYPRPTSELKVLRGVMGNDVALQPACCWRVPVCPRDSRWLTRRRVSDLRIEVRSLAPVGVPAGTALPGAGTGLIGLAERVALAGGELEHGVDPEGAFVLRARLPR